MKVLIRYYARLQEQAGLPEEWIETAATTPAEVWTQVVERHGFEAGRTHLLVAQNHDFCRWEDPLEDGATLVFIPPVAGG